MEVGLSLFHMESLLEDVGPKAPQAVQELRRLGIVPEDMSLVNLMWRDETICMDPGLV